MLVLILLCFAFVCFALGAWWNPAPPRRLDLVALGLAFAALALIVSHYPLRP